MPNGKTPTTLPSFNEKEGSTGPDCVEALLRAMLPENEVTQLRLHESEKIVTILIYDNY